MSDDARQRGLDKMNEVYGWDMQDQAGDFFGLTAEHLFGNIWMREGLSVRDRRLLAIGLLVGHGLFDLVDVQFDSGLRTGDLDEQALREIVIFLAHYAGWPKAARLNSSVEGLIAQRAEEDKG
jgi:4-carboxymuconolactone decarboxylase